MKKFKPIHARLLFIDLKLREGKFPNCSSLSKEWGTIGSRTIQRDLNYLRYEMDAPIEYSKEKRGFYYVEPQFQLPAFDLKESDVFALYLASKLLVHYQDTPVYDNLQTVFQKITASLPSNIPLASTNTSSRFTVIPTATTKIDPVVWATVSRSLRESHTIEIYYRIPGTAPTVRRIDPYHGVSYAGDWYVIAFCHLRKAIRVFSMARIIKAQLSQATFKVPADLNLDMLKNSYFGLHWGERDTRVRILFNKDIAEYIKERIWHPSQTIKEQPDGSIVFTLMIQSLQELKRWILSWDHLATVLEPQSLADDIKATLGQMMNNYLKK